MTEQEVTPPAAVVSSAQLKVIIGVMLILLTGAGSWATWVTVQITQANENIAVIRSTRYTPKDRLDDMKAEVIRYDQINTRVDDVMERLASMEGDMKEQKAISLRIEQAIEQLRKRLEP